MDSVVLIGLISCCASFCASEWIDRFAKTNEWAVQMDQRFKRAVQKCLRTRMLR